MRRMLQIATLVVAGMAIAGYASAETKTFHAKLMGKDEVPANNTTGSGTATVTLDTATKTITWDVTYSGLTGDALMAHIHGPAAPGANAGVEVDLGKGGVKSPITGKATLTDAQIADLEAGKTYINVHTAANKGGEIRGQLMP
jgi:hypothetical protein